MTPSIDILLFTSNPTLREVLSYQLPRLANIRCLSAENIQQYIELQKNNDISIGLYADIAPLPEALEKETKTPWITINIPVNLHDVISLITPHLRAASCAPVVMLDPAQRCGYVPGERLLRHMPSGDEEKLTEKEVELVQQLHQAGARGVSREALRERVWGHDDSIDTHTLETHIYRLRAKFRRLLGDDNIITSTPEGYRFAWEQTT